MCVCLCWGFGKRGRERKRFHKGLKKRFLRKVYLVFSVDSLWVRKELDTTERLSLSLSFSPLCPLNVDYIARVSTDALLYLLGG